MKMPLYSFHYKKRFGQNFLNSKRFAERIIDFADIDGEVVLEIGAGKGILTRYIAQRAKKVFAVEIDKNLAAMLKEMDLPNCRIMHDDFLKLDLKKFPKLVIIGNIPYSVSTSILEKLIAQRNFLKRAVLTVQKEYGQRLCAEVGSRQYGALTLSVNCFYQIVKGFMIPARFFSPQPKVSSVVISLIKKKPLLKINNETTFFEFVRGIFRYRRKSLKNAIISHLHMLPEGIDTNLLKKRPGNLTLGDYHRIFNMMSSQ